MRYAIVLDSNIFGEKDKHDFKNSRGALLASSMRSFKNIDVILPDIVIHELRSHITESIKEDEQQKKSDYLKRVLNRKFYDNLLKQNINCLEKFIKQNNIKVIECNKYIEIDKVNSWYFNKEMPFESRKKSEFPDAFIINSLMNYLKENKYDKVVIASLDKGFIQGITTHYNIDDYNIDISNSIGDIMNEYLGFNDSDIKDIKNYIIKNKILNNIDNYDISDIYLDDSFNVDKIETDITEIEIISKSKDNKNIDILVNFQAIFYGKFRLSKDTIVVLDDFKHSLYEHRYGNKIEVTNELLISLSLTRDNDKYTGYTVFEKVELSPVKYMQQLDTFVSYE